jgi:30S ribosomal protein S31
MGKGDRKTKKGKIFTKSYGNVRPHSEGTSAAAAAPAAAKKAATPAAKPAAKKAAPAKKKAAT